MPDTFPLGKLPHELLASLLGSYPVRDPRVILGPRPGEDAAVIDLGDTYLIAKTDPITFATDEIGWYAVHVNANDIAATGGTPAWFLATILLPENLADAEMAKTILDQIHAACDDLNVTLVGGHTEITYGIDRPIVTGVMLGLAEKDKLVLTGGAQPGDRLIVTKGVPVEATAIIAREKREELLDEFSEEFLARCAAYLHDPGISVVKDAAIATAAGRIHAMHDPTEGGLATGIWEMAEASGVKMSVDLSDVIISDAAKLCEAVGLHPPAAIASGALLMACHPDDAESIQSALEKEGIPAFDIGYAEVGEPAVVIAESGDILPRPSRDEIARLFE